MKIFGIEIKRASSSNDLNIFNQFMGQIFSLMGLSKKEMIQRGYLNSHNLFSVINWITLKASLMDWQLVDKNGEEIEEHPLLDLLNRPNSVMGKRQFIRAVVGYKKITGETFINKFASRAGRNAGIPKELWPIPSSIVDVKYDSLGQALAYKVGEKQTLTPEEVIYMREFHPTEPNGLSPIVPGQKAITRDNDTATASMRLLQNMGARGVLSLKGEGTANITKEQLSQFESELKEQMTGPNNYGSWKMLNHELVWQKIGESAKELDLFNQSMQNLRDIANLYQLNSQIFNDPENTTYDNIKEAKKDGLQSAVIPEMEDIASELNRDLVPLFDKNVTLKVTHSFPEMAEDQEKLVNSLSKAWWLTPNQKLEAMGKPVSDDPMMDEVFMPNSQVPLGTSTNKNLEDAHRRRHQGQ